MNRSLATLTDDLSEINNKSCKKCKERYDQFSPCTCIKLKINLLKHKCSECGDICKPIDYLIKKFSNTYRFCKRNNKFIQLIRKGVYPYEYMDSWEKFNETELPSKESFCSELNLEDITDKDYDHARKVWRTFNITNMKEYHDLYVQTYIIIGLYLRIFS